VNCLLGLSIFQTDLFKQQLKSNFMKMKHLPLFTVGFALALASCKKESTPNPTPDPAPTVTVISPTSGQKIQ